MTFEVDLKIPETALPCNEKYCKLIQVSYNFKVEAITSGCHCNFETIVPITILSPPYGSETKITHSDIAFAPAAPIELPYPTDHLLSVQPSAPPSYDEFSAAPTYREVKSAKNLVNTLFDFNKSYVLKSSDVGWKFSTRGPSSSQ